MRVNVSVLSVTTGDVEADLSSGVTTTMQAFAHASAQHFAVVHERDRENVLLGPNWWTTIPLLFEDGAIPSVAQLEDYMLLSLQAESVSGCKAVTFTTVDNSEPNAFQVETSEQVGGGQLGVVAQPSAEGALAMTVTFQRTASTLVADVEPQDVCSFEDRTDCEK